MIRLFFALLAIPCLAQELTVEQLFKRPFLWGTEPEKPKWAKSAPVLGFLWNAEGRRFKDLYAFRAQGKKLVRLTDLEREKDELNRTEEEKDERRKKYLAPLAGIADYQLSRDGSQAVFSYRGDLYLVRTDGAKPPFRLTRTKTSETNPVFSPDASKIAFLRDKQLYVQDLAGGQLTQVSDIDDPDSTLTDFRWSPDGKRFLLVVRKGKARQMPLPNYSGKFVTATPFPRAVAGEDPVEAVQLIVPADGGKAVTLEAVPYGGKAYRSDPPEWSPDSKLLLQRVTHPQMKKLAILCFDADTGKARILTEESDPKWVYGSKIGWAPDSKRVFFTSERDGWAHLYIVPAEGGQAVQVTKGAWEIHPEPLFMFDPQWVGEYLYYSSTEGGTNERHFYRVKPDGSGKERLSEHEGLNVGIVSGDGKHIAWKRADLRNPLDLWVDGTRVTTSPLAAFYKQWWPETQFVTFPSAKDGKPVAAKILLPRGYRPDDKTLKPRPAILFIHGSGYATSVLKQWGSYQELRYAFNCYLASKGYVVLDIDYRGSSGYGRDWRTDVYLHLGGPDLEDVLGGVEYLRKLGNIDMKRLGLWGVSYGGFMTNMAMFQAPDVFRAGSSWAAVNDWENYNPSYTTQRLNTPKSDPEAYRISSPINFSSRLKNHLLLIHGMGDSNVLFQDTVQLAEKLIHEGKDFGQAYYPQEDHGFVRDETLIDAFRRTAEWFDRYLGQ